jgi:hypothetical protein
MAMNVISFVTGRIACRAMRLCALAQGRGSRFLHPGAGAFSLTAGDPRAPKNDFREAFQADLGCPVLARKISRFRRRANHL